MIEFWLNIFDIMEDPHVRGRFAVLFRDGTYTLWWRDEQLLNGETLGSRVYSFYHHNSCGVKEL